MIPPGPQLIENLTSLQLTTLTHLLTLPTSLSPTNPIHLASQRSTISSPSFPSKLKYPKPLLLRLALHAYPNIFQKAHLCPTHSPLNPYLIRRIFIQVSAEATVRLGRLLAAPYPLSEHVQAFVARLHALNGLWMSVDLYLGIKSPALGENAPEEHREYERIENDCESCILSRIGGDKQALSDLRTNLIGRRKKRGPKPRLLALVESWIANLPENDNNEVLSKSDKLGREVREIRRSMQKERRRLKDKSLEQEMEIKRRSDELEAREAGRQSVEMTERARDPALICSGSSNTVTVPFCYRSGGQEEPLLGQNQGPNGAEESNEEHDPVESIIDFYSHRLSANFAPRTSMHPAFKDSMIFDPQSGTFQARQSQSRSRSNTPLPQYIPPRPPVPKPNPRNTIHELANTRSQHRRAEIYTPSLYPQASTYEPASTIFTPSRRNSLPHLPSSLRYNAEERAREYRNLVGSELNADGTPPNDAREHRRLLQISEASELSTHPNTPQETPAWSTTPTTGGQQNREQRWDGEDVPHPRRRLTRVEARRRSGEEEERMRVAELDDEDVRLRRGRAESRSTHWGDFCGLGR